MARKNGGKVTVVGICAVQLPVGERLHAALSDGRVYLMDADGAAWVQMESIPLEAVADDGADGEDDNDADDTVVM
jgi:hypothetical protein